MTYCRCADAHCLDAFVKCGECDEDGYPLSARRRLKRCADGTVQDIDDQKIFRVKKTKVGNRLVPKFEQQVDWKGAKGFAAMLLLLSCLGAEGEYVLWDSNKGAEMDEEGWRKRKYKAMSKPSIRHRACGETVTSTYITSLTQGHSIGCSCNLASAHHWRHRRPEVVRMGRDRGFVVETDEEAWLNECTGIYYCPILRCNQCAQIVTSTCIASLTQGRGIGCHCRTKTETKLLEWLNERFPQDSGVTVSSQYRGPKTARGGQTHFDFHLAFPDGFEVIVELDGAQHFWGHRHTDEGCKRDLLKETWAVQHGMCVVRVLQDDVWRDQFDWQGWLVQSFDAARSGKPRCITPDAPEYRSYDSAYVRLRRT